MKALIVTTDLTQFVQKAQHFAKYTNSLLFLGRLNNLHNSMPSVLNLSYSMPHALTLTTRALAFHTFPPPQAFWLTQYLCFIFTYIIYCCLGCWYSRITLINTGRWMIESMFFSKINSSCGATTVVSVGKINNISKFELSLNICISKKDIFKTFKKLGPSEIAFLN